MIPIRLPVHKHFFIFFARKQALSAEKPAKPHNRRTAHRFTSHPAPRHIKMNTQLSIVNNHFSSPPIQSQIPPTPLVNPATCGRGPLHSARLWCAFYSPHYPLEMSPACFTAPAPFRNSSFFFSQLNSSFSLLADCCTI